MQKLLIIMLILFSSSILGKNNFEGKKILCTKLLWGFEFISSDKVNVINTNINKQTDSDEYYYELDFDLSYLNIYLSKNNLEDRIFSIHRETLRVDIWTMTSGGITTREMIPAGLCKIIEIDNIIEYIEDMKNTISESRKN